MAEFREWDSFYVILGGAAAALIGLQFVVLTLIAERPPTDAYAAGAAFATPTIVHFGTTLLISALLRVPWQAVSVVALLWGVIGVAGVVYAFVITRRMQIQKAYEPQLEDWLFYILFPLAAYATLVVSAFMAGSQTREALFGVGAAALALLFIGIHNAWDAVTYHVLVNRRSGKE
jgi:hypothetical protein